MEGEEIVGDARVQSSDLVHSTNLTDLCGIVTWNRGLSWGIRCHIQESNAIIKHFQALHPNQACVINNVDHKTNRWYVFAVSPKNVALVKPVWSYDPSLLLEIITFHKKT